MEPTKPTAIRAAKALIGPELVEVDDAVVVVEGTSIAAAGSRDRVTIPDGSGIVDHGDATLLPGFIDAHVHIGFSRPAEVLRGGITCVRDLAWPVEEIYPLADRSRDPDFDGPLVLTVGPMLTVAGGYPITATWAPPGTGLALRSVDDARAAVVRLATEGVAAIKIALNPPAGAVLPDDLLTAIVNEAHAHDLRVTAHIHGLEQLHRALDAGVDELAHMLMSPEAIPDDTIARMVAAETVVIPTLSIFPPWDLDIAIENLARFLNAGGRVVYGTDLGNEGPGPGIDTFEVTRMEQAGMSPLDIVRSATVDSARLLGLDSKGVLEAGMDADIICVEGSIERAVDLVKVRGVIRAGRLVR